MITDMFSVNEKKSFSYERIDHIINNEPIGDM